MKLICRFDLWQHDFLRYTLRIIEAYGVGHNVSKYMNLAPVPQPTFSVSLVLVQGSGHYEWEMEQGRKWVVGLQVAGKDLLVS